MDAQAAFDARDSFHVVDVREPFEWDMGHVDGSIHIPVQQIQDRVAELPTDKPLLCVCMVGIRSQYAANALAEAGFETENLDGGLAAWVAGGLPLVKDDVGQATVWTPD
jgi:rhodanese-related sulfurtransferase